MGIAISIFAIEKFDLESIIEKRGEVVLPLQQDLASEYGLGDKLGTPVTKIKLVKKTQDGASFDIIHYSDTIKETIRFCPEGEEFAKYHEGGYQKVYRFWAIKNDKDQVLICAATKEISKQFNKRLEETKLVKMNRISFDLEKIYQAIDCINVWGSWADVNEGEVKVRAEFGVNVHQAPTYDPKNTTALAIEMKTDDGEHISISISKDGRIATNCKSVTAGDLIKIYQAIREKGGIIVS
ncbi:hypothetical protein KKB44_04040 [Candidatus Micrarchaeota archaeon]|nr:hypothetical protein [Candidatus Micrarchaeota archaeon]